MKKNIIFLCCAALVLLILEGASAHGIRGKLSSQNALTVTAEYDDGEPVAYATVDIFGPGSKLPFQSGRTDKNGAFAFCPDTAGEWKVIINDGMGHRLALKTNFSTKRMAENQEMAADVADTLVFPRFQAIVTSLSLIFGIFGLVTFMRGKQKKE